MPLTPKISLQINLSPGDYPHVRLLLRHQLDVLAGQVADIQLTIDTRPSKGRFSLNWDKYKEQLDTFLREEIQPAYHARLVFVDYGAAMKQEIARYFFGRNHIPEKDFRGGPFYAYFFGLFNALNNVVLHLDSDIFLGGRSSSWVAEAQAYLDETPSCLVISPLSGPPHPEDRLVGQPDAVKLAPYTYAFPTMSTRIFMIDKTRLYRDKLALTRPPLRQQVKAIWDGNDSADLPEHLLSGFMAAHGLKRIDLPGKPPGLWSLHPPYRTADFYARLPQLIDAIEQGRLPAAQLGFYDIVDEVCDWSTAREELENKRWWKRILKKAN